jgi:hypothetical protein
MFLGVNSWFQPSCYICDILTICTYWARSPPRSLKHSMPPKRRSACARPHGVTVHNLPSESVHAVCVARTDINRTGTWHGDPQRKATSVWASEIRYVVTIGSVVWCGHSRFAIHMLTWGPRGGMGKRAENVAENQQLEISRRYKQRRARLS